MDYNPWPMSRPTADTFHRLKRRIVPAALCVIAALLISEIVWKADPSGERLAKLPGVSPASASEACEQTNFGIQSMEQSSIGIVNSLGELVRIQAFIADDQQERSFGYQFICESVISETFILFVYPREVNARFHMNNVVAPLDIGFFDGQGNLIATRLMTVYEEGENTLYHPDKPFRYALEAAPGFFDSRSIKPGSARLSTGTIYP